MVQFLGASILVQSLEKADKVILLSRMSLKYGGNRYFPAFSSRGSNPYEQRHKVHYASEDPSGGSSIGFHTSKLWRDPA